MTSPSSSADAASLHVSVMLEEVLEGLELKAGGRYLDGTLGMGGHSFEILRRSGAGTELLGLDQDAEAIALAAKRLEPFGKAVHLRQSRFADFETALDELGWDLIDGALVDLGVSSFQIDTAERGFSFLHDGPLDMRMNPNSGAESAYGLVNRASFHELKEIIEIYGEEPQAGRIARAIEAARLLKPIERTLELAKIVEMAYPPKWRATSRNHPATRTFQALRLAVNEELTQISTFLERIVPRLKVGGRIAVISFHSLEDRIVKHFFRTAASGCLCPPQVLHCACGHEASLQLVTKKALIATSAEIAANPRSRSAKLRVASRTSGAFSLPQLASNADGGRHKKGAPRFEKHKGSKPFGNAARPGKPARAGKTGRGGNGGRSGR